MTAKADGRFVAACVQMRTGSDLEANIRDAESLVREAAGLGAQFVTTPEMTSFLNNDRKEVLKVAVRQEDDPALKRLSALAGELKIWLLLGSLPIRLDGDMLANRSFLVDTGGNLAAVYDKIHMFDVDLSDGETFRESRSYLAGDRAVVAELPWARLGMSVCYDVRFPYLYRAMAQAGADLLAVPAAFTRQTGEAHWHTLLKARAIENGAFVFAAAQGGRHDTGRETYGHSMIISPWGEILAEAGTDPGVIIAEIDPELARKARRSVPALFNGRRFSLEKTWEPRLEVVP